MRKEKTKRNRIFGLSLIVIIAMVLGCIPMELFAASTDDYIVITKNEKTAEKIENSYNVSVDENIDGANNVLSGTLTEAQAEKIEDNQNVECVEKDFTSEKEETNIAPDVQPAVENWEEKMISATDIKQSGDKVKIAVIDSGIDLTENFDVKEREDFVKDRESTILFDDTCGHGTSVASVILGKGIDSEVQGLAQKAEIYSAKILNEKQQAPVSRAVKAIYWAIDKDVDIINISFGTKKYSSVLEKAVNDAADKGILVVAAVGNNGKKGIDYPAKFKSVLSVGAVNAKGKVSSFSSKGNKVDVVAPGEAITAQANFGEDLVLSGSSLATPYVTSIAADLWSRDKSKSAEFIKQLIIDSSRKIKSKSGKIDNLIDYENANRNYLEAYKRYMKLNDMDNIIENNEKVSNSNIEIEKKKEEKLIKENNTKPENEAKNIVKGSWRHQIHQKNCSNLKMKEGAAYPDLWGTKIDGMSAHPLFHGYAGKVWGKSDVNYVAAYRYLARVAMQYKAGKNYKKVTRSMAKGLTYEQYTKMRNFIKRLTKIKPIYCSKKFRKWKKYEKASYIMGIAMHTATDAFAHSVYIKDSKGKIVRLYHQDSSNGRTCLKCCCDNPNYYPNRAKMALNVEKNIVKRYKGKRKGIEYGREFYVSQMKDPKTYKDFRINMLGVFARQAGVVKPTALKYMDAVSTFVEDPPEPTPPEPEPPENPIE